MKAEEEPSGSTPEKLYKKRLTQNSMFYMKGFKTGAVTSESRITITEVK